MQYRLACTLGLMLISPSLANADAFSFFIQSSGGGTIAFTIPDAPVVSSASPSVGTVLSGILVRVSTASVVTNVGFGVSPFPDLFIGNNAAISAGLVSSGSPSYLNAYGQTLFSGSPTAPLFIPGVYSIDNSISDPAGFNPGIDQLTITDISRPQAVTPEPSSLLLIGTGLLGGAGVFQRRRAAGWCRRVLNRSSVSEPVQAQKR